MAKKARNLAKNPGQDKSINIVSVIICFILQSKQNYYDNLCFTVKMPKGSRRISTMSHTNQNKEQVMRLKAAQ